MKTTSRQWTPFLLACGLASALIAGGCTFDSSQLRALGPDSGLGGAGKQGGTDASVDSAGGNGGASVAGAGGGGAGGTGGQVATTSSIAPGTCVPGASVACACSNREQGAQTCTSAGTFAACVCAAPTVDAGGGGGISGTGGGLGAGGTANLGGTATGGLAIGGGTGDGTGGTGQGTGGAGIGGTGTGGATAPMLISIDFVGGGVAVDSGATGTVVMGATESAGVKPATHWNSAASNTGTLASLTLADGTTTSASATWTTPIASGETSATGSLDWPDSPGDVRMMNGYLDPRATASPATINVTGLASPMSSGYDVYVYCFEDMTWADTRTSKYTIGPTTHTVKQTEPPQVTSFPGYTLAPEGGAGNYVVFTNVTGTSFTLTATPGTSLHSTVRAPVNGIQIVYPSGS
ncbi:MAG: hypothetical protein ACLP66_23070 [Polyangia bacterium]